jgi:hypothetical protein
VKKIIENQAMGIPLLAFFVGLFIAFTCDGTADNGDSVQHYLISKYAWQHPVLFLDHWGKPLFTLLSSPFSQFGMEGIKVFNLIVFTSTLYLTGKIAQRLQLSPWIAQLALWACPYIFPQVFGGLTEHLFALWLMAAVFAYQKERFILAAFLISWMPFIRSEGLMMMGILGGFLFLEKQWKSLPFLLSGTLIYSIAGAFHYGDLLWVWTKTPYLLGADNYGSGKPFHFFEQLFYITGIVVMIAAVLGLIRLLVSPRKIKENKVLWLCLSLFMVFIVAHSIFWTYGLFHSYGMSRVLMGVLPCFALLAAFGVNWTQAFKNKSLRIITKGTLVLGVLILPFVIAKYKVVYPKSFSANYVQILFNDFIESKQNQANFKNADYILTDSPHVRMKLNIDPWDTLRHENMYKIPRAALKEDPIIVWDKYFSVLEAGVSFDRLEKEGFIPRKKLIDAWHQDTVYIIYTKANSAHTFE